MTHTKKTILTIIGLFSLQFAIAQSSMKEPVSFKLKNGITVIVAENAGMGKVYASLSSDNHASAQVGISENLDLLLNLKAKQALNKTFGDRDKKITPSVKFERAEANVSSDVTDFNNTFSIMSSTVQNIAIDEQSVQKNLSVAEVKAFYNQHFAPSKTVITIAGDITINQAKSLVKKTFADLKEQNFLAAG